MDHIIQLELPNPFLRLETILHYVSLYLTPYLHDSQQSILQELYENHHTKLTIDHTIQQIIKYLEETYQLKINEIEENIKINVNSKKVEVTSTTSVPNNSKKKSKKSSSQTQDEPPVDITPQNENQEDTQVNLFISIFILN